jgi:hypothetical protein
MNEILKSIKENLAIATIEAIVTFGKNEGYFAINQQDYFTLYKSAKNNEEGNRIIKNYMPIFKKFTEIFKLNPQFTLPNNDTPERYELVKNIFQYYLPNLEKENSVFVVKEFANRTRSLGKKKHLLSLCSKIAFLYNPRKFAIYDKTVKKAFGDSGYVIKMGFTKKKFEEDYIVFSKVFETFLGEVVLKLNIDEYLKEKKYMEIVHNSKAFEERYDSFLKNCHKLGVFKDDIDELLIRRIIDKALMISGDFKREGLVVFEEGFLL